MTRPIASLFIILFSGLLVAQDVGHNLKVLKPAGKAELKQVMDSFTDELGVECVFCHNMRDKSSDEKKHKQIARKMLEMTLDINTEYFSWEGADQISCWTCHQGHKEPVERE